MKVVSYIILAAAVSLVSAAHAFAENGTSDKAVFEALQQRFMFAPSSDPSLIHTYDWGLNLTGPEIWLAMRVTFRVPRQNESKFAQIIDSPICRTHFGYTAHCIGVALRSAEGN